MTKTYFRNLLLAACIASASAAMIPRYAHGRCSFTAQHKQHCNPSAKQPVNYIGIPTIYYDDHFEPVVVKRASREPGDNDGFVNIHEKSWEIGGLRGGQVLSVRSATHSAGRGQKVLSNSNSKTEFGDDSIIFGSKDVEWTSEDRDEYSSIGGWCTVGDWDSEGWECGTQSSETVEPRTRQMHCTFAYW